MRRALILVTLLACETSKIEPNPAPAPPPAPTTTTSANPDAGPPAEMVMVDAPLDSQPALTAVPIPGGVKLERTGRSYCPLNGNGASVRAAVTGPRMVSVFVNQVAYPNLVQCGAKANITVRGLEPGHWRIFVLGMGGRLDVEVDVAAP